MKYLVTGGAGFIGSHLTDALVARGDLVTVLDNGSTGNFDNLAQHDGTGRVEVHQGSILDDHLVRKLVGEADVVVHLAAAVGVQLIVQRPLESLITNIRGTEIVLEACADHTRRVLVASTSEIYGKNANGPLSEESDRILGSTLKSRWSYSTSKAVDEILAYTFWRERGTPSIVVRLFNCIGPRQTGAYGMVAPSFIRQSLAGEDVTVYGNGDQRRCFCHVEDTVRGILGLLDHPDSPGSVYNIGNKQEISINDLARMVTDMTGSLSKVVHIPYDVAYEEGFEDMERRVPDTARINALTGWESAKTLEETIADMIAYERSSLAVQ
ncbi:MAG: NAD-dependent epimerase/dehydratase family protein [Actinomycetota bacterium]